MNHVDSRPRLSTRAVEVAIESRDGTRLHGSLWRAESPRAGLLLVHGMQSHAGWFEVSGTADDLAADGHIVLAFDRRGSGRSEGPRGDSPSSEAFFEDLAAARSYLAAELAECGAAGAPLHVLANCFGTRIVLPYLAEHPAAFASVILTAPATHMSRAADYRLTTKLHILAAPGAETFATPLEDGLFVSRGPFLDWIRSDCHALREVTARFLRATQLLTRKMHRAARELEVPMLVILGSRDAMVINDKIKEEFVARYKGPIEVIELGAEHYVDFTDQQPTLAGAVSRWVATHSGLEETP